MPITRRRLVHSLALAGGYKTTAEGAEPRITVDVLRDMSAVHGTNLSDDRLRVLAPVLKNRLTRIQALRDFEVDDSVTPTPGILG